MFESCYIMEHSRRIAFYINVLTKGGAERVMSQLANQFAEHGYEVFLITSFQGQGEYSLSDKVKRLNLEKEQDFGNRLQRNVRLVEKLRYVLKKIKPAVLISFMQEPNFRAIMATRGLNIKTIISVRNDPNMEYAGKVGEFVGIHLLPMADGCVFQTEEARKWFPVKLQKKSKIIFNEVSTTFFDKNWRAEDQRIVTVGRLTEQKNQKMLIEAFYNISDEFPECTLEIYGEGPLREDLQRQITSYGLNNRIFLKGEVDNIPEVLSKASLFVLPSNYEGMPNALLEALAVGVPSISTDCPCGGPRMLIKNEENGLLIRSENIGDLKDAIKKVLGNKYFSRKLSVNAKESAKKFRPDFVFGKWEEYVNSVIDG